jgi:hypothetical protein
MAVRMQRVVCSACGHDHNFSIPVGEAMSRAYGYTCPETGRPAAIGPRGQWETSEYPTQGAVVLSPIGVAAEASAP